MNPNQLRGLLLAMSAPWTFYVLGAGTSFDLIPISGQIPSRIQPRYESIGLWPAGPNPTYPLRSRILRNWAHKPGDLSGELLSNIGHGTLELLVQHALWYPDSPRLVPPQYAVFQQFGRPSVLFSFNLDGLAMRYCASDHHVLEPHGRIDEPWVAAPDFDDLVYLTVDVGIGLPHLRPKVLPGPEPSWITGSQPYVSAQRLFPRSHAVIIVGYSFGQYNGRLDDFESFEFLIDLLLTYPRPVFVLSPAPAEIAALIEERTRSRQVFSLFADWAALSAAIVAFNRDGRALSEILCSNQLEELLIRYHAFTSARGQGAC